MRKLLLASSSPYRRKLLQQLNLDFDVASPAVDEQRLPDESAADMAVRLGRKKAVALTPDYPHHLIIGSDQAAALDDRLLTKPGTREKAVSQLQACSGRTVTFYSSICLACGETDQCVEQLVSTRVHFRTLSLHQIHTYVELEQPLDCAGSFKCEGLGIRLFEAIESEDPSALVGLPLIALTTMLLQFGVDPLQ